MNAEFFNEPRINLALKRRPAVLRIASTNNRDSAPHRPREKTGAVPSYIILSEAVSPIRG
jgi:hypothetical protein